MLSLYFYNATAYISLMNPEAIQISG